MISIKEVNDKKTLNDFVDFIYENYEGDKNFVPPLRSDYIKYVQGVDNDLNEAGPNIKYICYDDDKVVGRLLVGVNNIINEYHGFKEGYISLFECVENYEYAEKLLDKAIEFLKSHGMTKVKGPLSLPGGEDNRGFIVDNFDAQPFIMNTYNKKYYNDFFIKYGFEKYFDCYAYKDTIENADIERYEKLVPYAMKKFDFRVDNINLSNVDKDAMDIMNVLERALPREWDDFAPPREEEIRKIVKQLVPFADSDLIFIARDNKTNEPIGFNITLPDYNQAIKKMNGRLFPFGFLKFLYYKRKINRLRFFVLFVVPEYRKKGVTSVMYLKTYLNALKKGYTELEGSTIWEYNRDMMNDVESFGAKINITYRIYQKDI
ncbi:hypothetical protein C3V37_02510 [Peptostreptococcaceae bacterium oral taxon 929]|nr:hypothetical protein C3V37_02510 [Peptostreptococcaceae bacterium oral taxon 929]